jgi:methionyl-tRNA formyltransferase
MRIVVFGYGIYAERVLPVIAEKNQIQLVVTHNYNENAGVSAGVSEFSNRHGIKLLRSYDARETEIKDEVKRASPDIIVICNWRRKLDPYYVHLPKYPAINVHDSYLPKYAGFNATNWAIRNNERHTGVTVHEIDEDLDTGPILLQEKLPIYFSDTAADVDKRILDTFPKLLKQAINKIAAGDRCSTRNGGVRSFYHRITKRDARIDWRRCNIDVYNLIRAQSDPYVNAWTTHKGELLYITGSMLPPDTSYGGTPGRIIENRSEGTVVACGPSQHVHSQLNMDGIIIRTIKDSRGTMLSTHDYFSNCVGTYLE